MKERDLKWLRGELPKWIAQDIITEEVAAKIRAYYGEPERTQGLRLALAIFGTLGAVLIGSGIILLFAKNWASFSISVRTVLSLLPLILGQFLMGWVLFKEKESLAWREGAAAFLFLGIGASISLIGQTYHIPSDAPRFVLAWLVLSLPLAYLLEATLPAIFYLFGIVAWAGMTRSEDGYTFFYWILLALIFSYLFKKFKKHKSSNSFTFLLWALSLSLCISLGVVLEHQLPGLWIIVYSCYFIILVSLGRTYNDTVESGWQNPLLIVGLLGSLILSFVLTYEEVWKRVGWHYFKHELHYNWLNAIQDYVLTALMVVGLGVLVYRQLKGRDKLGLVFSFLPTLAILGFFIASLSGSEIPYLLFNAYLLVLGIYIVLYGLRENSLGVTNGGMLILAVLIVLRFFDSGLGFLVKGIAFILVGLGFLLGNFMLVRRKKGGAQ